MDFQKHGKLAMLHPDWGYFLQIAEAKEDMVGFTLGINDV